jgi:hypothetical protein
MFLPFGFSIQEYFICYFYCQKMDFVCEFQHPFAENNFFGNPAPHNFGEYEILRTCT